MHDHHQHMPRKRFGQNFLIDKNVINHIVQAIRPQTHDLLVEIGPGLGALTEPLLQQVPKLNVIELDRDVIPKLEQKCAALGELTIHQTDALKFDFMQLIDTTEQLRVVGNLPYNISTPLLFHILQYANNIQDMHFMLQKEVVDRMAAQPNSKDYGRLSVMLQYYCKITPLFTVKPESFRPPPKVNSAIVRLEPYKVSPYSSLHSQPDFAHIVKHAFAQRRKTLRNNLKDILSVDAISDCEIDPSKRAEVLSVEDFVKLANILSNSTRNVS